MDGPFSFESAQSYSNNTLSYLLDVGNCDISHQCSFTSFPARDVDVTINLSHGNIPDLDVFLVSPKGTRIELFTDLNTNSNEHGRIPRWSMKAKHFNPDWLWNI